MTGTPLSTPPKISSRIKLKLSLQSERRTGFERANCPVCGKAIGSAVEMHEVLLTKGDVQGCSPEVREAINVRENCVLVHPECHPAAQHERQAKTRCIQQLILFNGFHNIQRWLFMMAEMMKGSQAVEAVLQLNGVMEAMQERMFDTLNISSRKTWG